MNITLFYLRLEYSIQGLSELESIILDATLWSYDKDLLELPIATV